MIMMHAMLGGALLLAPVPGAAATDPETLREQAAAQAAEAGWLSGFPVPGRMWSRGAAGDAPLFVGVDDSGVPAYRINVDDGSATPQFSGFQLWAAAYDPAENQVYFTSGSTLGVWPVGGTPSVLGTITDTGGATQVMVGLAFHNGHLYGTKNIANEGVWEINPVSLVATILIDYVDGDLDCGGLAVDPATGDFLCTNDAATPYGAGLVRINTDASVDLITPYPAGETDIDGLAISSDRRAYLVTDEPGDIYVWDLAAAAYQTPIGNPWMSSEIFAAAAWITSDVIFADGFDP
ncbi:MAG: hypothetical protein F9K31_03690 [Dokdonella sp.]|nr:MAG: hypothetical protein F9K31_03690 [Dokdonella sp.]